MKSILDYRGAVFDLDGTLTESMHVWDHICRDWLLSRGKDPEADLEKIIEEMTVTQSAAYIKKRYAIGNTEKEIAASWQDMVLDQYRTGVALKKDIVSLAAAFREKGAKNAIATSCFPAACEAVLERYALRRFFTAIVYTDEAPGGKEDPHIWRMAAERLGLSPKDCVAFEDSRRALAGARKAGMACAAVYDKSCGDWELMKAEADWALVPENGPFC
jgi:HAD superfamily hydrolase (TIGR01509 family)